jgi:hypothetical protein
MAVSYIAEYSVLYVRDRDTHGQILIVNTKRCATKKSWGRSLRAITVCFGLQVAGAIYLHRHQHAIVEQQQYLSTGTLPQASDKKQSTVNRLVIIVVLCCFCSSYQIGEMQRSIDQPLSSFFVVDQ